MHRWRKFRRLSWSERALFLQALWLLPLTALAVRCVGFRRCHWVLAGLVPPEETHAKMCRNCSPLPQAKATARMMRAAAQHGLYPANCLEQSLALWWLLGRRGIKSHLRIGVRRAARQLEGHAWVEVAGAALNEPQDSQRPYVPFDRAIAPMAVSSR
jgi:hypothetical protein